MFACSDMAAFPLPNVADDLDHAESQRILKEEQGRYGQQDLSTFFQDPQEDEEDLQGEPLSLKEVKKLCPNFFVRDQLFHISGRAKETAPLKLSDLQHKGLARILLLRFIRQERSLPNNNQVAIYFIQQCFVHYILRRRVNWQDRPRNAGVGLGRVGDRAAARCEDVPQPPRKRPIVLLPEEHEHIVEMASQGAVLASQGESVESLKARISELEAENDALKTQLAMYHSIHGDLPSTNTARDEAGTSRGDGAGASTGDGAGSSGSLFNIEDFLREGYESVGI